MRGAFGWALTRVNGPERVSGGWHGSSAPTLDTKRSDIEKRTVRSRTERANGERSPTGVTPLGTEAEIDRWPYSWHREISQRRSLLAGENVGDKRVNATE
jgi:hypothetical protein